MWMEAEWEFEEVNDIFFNTYSDQDVELEAIDIDPKEFLPQVLQSCAFKNTKPKAYDA